MDVSHNAIAALANLSSLAQLRTLCLEANRIASVADAAQYLPVSLEVLTLGSNQVWVCAGVCVCPCLSVSVCTCRGRNYHVSLHVDN